MKIDFSQAKMVGIDGNPIEDCLVHQTLAKVIYAHTTNLDLVEIARVIYQGEEVELRGGDIKEIRRLLSSDELGMASFARKALLDYIDDAEKKEKEQSK